MKTVAKVTKSIAENLEKYVMEDRYFDVVLEFTIKGEEVSAPKVINVESGYEYLREKGYREIGFKCYQKDARVNRKIAYLFFESGRLGDTIGALKRDVENIKNDVKTKI